MDDTFDVTARTAVYQARLPDANEIRQIFARIDLTDTFWDPQADKFQTR